ncbi:type VII secretion-associated serine protease mycosin [Streptomyces sp. NPDC056628]|uniref:type VII secretion-associated serine protease mycosin n=1 Tax=Streptomyces sp. NPDC056628 TaxID=3345882 RepID=UPI00368EDBC5
MSLTGALLFAAAPAAFADYVRDQQWALNAFAAEDVWAESEGAGVTVAVVDSGVDGSHPDLTGQVLEGKDFTGDGNAQDDVLGHGTKMASLIAGHGHGAGNSSGVIGLAPKAKIMPLRTLRKDSDRNLDETWGAAVKYAVDHGAKVINLSIANDGGKTLSAGREAIAYAQQHDVVVVAGSGNDGYSAVSEPAALPGVISVGAVDEKANLWADSNTGKGLTLTAPGAKIVGANPTMSNGYGVGSGTSDATAYVSAAAALVRSKYPDLSAGQVINRLIKTATFAHHEGLKAPDEKYGYGIVRPYSALTMDVPAGSKKNPLGQLDAASVSNQSSPGKDSATQAEKKPSSSNLVLVGGIAAVVVIGVIAFVVIRSRRNGGNNGGPGAGAPSPAPGYRPYPDAAAGQGYSSHPGQGPQNPNPYS